MNNTISTENGFYQRALEIALCTDPPHQPTRCLSKLWQNPSGCIALGGVLCVIAIAAVVGIVLLGIGGMLSMHCVLPFVLVGLVCLSLLAVGIALVYQGLQERRHALPKKPADILTYLRNRESDFEKTVQVLHIKKQQSLVDGTDTYRIFSGYADAMGMTLSVLKKQCIAVETSIAQNGDE